MFLAKYRSIASVCPNGIFKWFDFVRLPFHVLLVRVCLVGFFPLLFIVVVLFARINSHWWMILDPQQHDSTLTQTQPVQYNAYRLSCWHLCVRFGPFCDARHEFNSRGTAWNITKPSGWRSKKKVSRLATAKLFSYFSDFFHCLELFSVFLLVHFALWFFCSDFSAASLHMFSLCICKPCASVASISF